METEGKEEDDGKWGKNMCYVQLRVFRLCLRREGRLRYCQMFNPSLGCEKGIEGKEKQHQEGILRDTSKKNRQQRSKGGISRARFL